MYSHVVLMHMSRVEEIFEVYFSLLLRFTVCLCKRVSFLSACDSLCSSIFWIGFGEGSNNGCRVNALERRNSSICHAFG